MNIDEVKTKKNKVIQEISEILNKFTNETGTIVTYLSVYPAAEMTGKVKFYVVEMDVKI